MNKADDNRMICDDVEHDEGLNNNIDDKTNNINAELRTALESSGLLSTFSQNLEGALVETSTIKDGLLKLQSGRETKHYFSYALLTS